MISIPGCWQGPASIVVDTYPNYPHSRLHCQTNSISSILDTASTYLDHLLTNVDQDIQYDYLLEN